MRITVTDRDDGAKKYYSMCTICNLHLITPKDIAEHYGGTLHAFMMGVVRTQLSCTGQFKTLEEKIKSTPKKESIIGLEYVYEYAEDGEGVRMYVCKLCNRALKDDSIFCHVAGIRHRVLYLSKHHPIMGISNNFKVRQPSDHKKLQNNTFAIEQTNKKNRIKVVNEVFVHRPGTVQYESFTEDLSPPQEELDCLKSHFENLNPKRKPGGPPQPHESGSRPKFKPESRGGPPAQRGGGDVRPQYGHAGGSSYQHEGEKGAAYQNPYGSQYPYASGQQYQQDNSGDPGRGGPGQQWGYDGYPPYHRGSEQRPREEEPAYRHGPSAQDDLSDIDVRSRSRGPQYQHDRADDKRRRSDYDDIDVRAMSRKDPRGFPGDLDLRSKERIIRSDFQNPAGDIDVRSVMRAGGTSFRELKATHEATLRRERYSGHFYPGPGVNEEKDCDSDMEVRSMEFSDCDPEDFWCNEELFEFLRNYIIRDDQGVQFAKKVQELFSNSVTRHKQRTESLRKRILEEKIRLEEEKKAFLELKSKKESKSPPPSKKKKDLAVNLSQIQQLAMSQAGPRAPVMTPNQKRANDLKAAAAAVIRANVPKVLLPSFSNPKGPEGVNLSQMQHLASSQIHQRGPLIKTPPPFGPRGNAFGDAARGTAGETRTQAQNQTQAQKNKVQAQRRRNRTPVQGLTRQEQRKSEWLEKAERKRRERLRLHHMKKKAKSQEAIKRRNRQRKAARQRSGTWTKKPPIPGIHKFAPRPVAGPSTSQ